MVHFQANPPAALDCITLNELEVQLNVGVPDAERSVPQRLLITIELFLDLAQAASQDDIQKTINYYDVSKAIQQLGKERQWKLIETAASDIASRILERWRPVSVRVEVKKFILPETKYVSVTIQRPKT